MRRKQEDLMFNASHSVTSSAAEPNNTKKQELYDACGRGGGEDGVKILEAVSVPLSSSCPSRSSV